MLLHGLQSPACASIQDPRSNRPDCHASPAGVAAAVARPATAARGSSFSPARAHNRVSERKDWA